MGKAFRKGKLRFHGELKALAKPAAFDAWWAKARQRQWVVYAKRPFGGPQQVLKYLARYTHRVAISNRRLLALEGGRVTFAWKDYAHGHQSQAMTLEAVEFIRRFLLHVLPSGLVRIHFGFLANRKRKQKLALCRSLLPARPTTAELDATSPNDRDAKSPEPESQRCPICKIGRLVSIEVLTAEALAHWPAPVIADTS